MSRIRKVLVRKRRKNEHGVKFVLSLLHLWLGLLSAIVVFVVCFTGCLYAFKGQVEYIAYSDYRTIEKKGGEDLQAAYDTFESTLGVPTQGLVFPDENLSIEITSVSKQNRGMRAYFNPNTGELLGKQSSGMRDFFYIILELHRWLMVEEPGKTIVGSFVLVFVYMLISGVVMWLPKRKKDLRKSLMIKLKGSFFRVNYDLHKVLGFYASLLLLFIALTGLYVSFYWVKNLTIQSLGGPSIVIDEENLGQSGLSKDLSSSFSATFKDLMNTNKTEKMRLSLNVLYEIARSELPRKGRMHITFPISEDGYYTFRKFGRSAFTSSIGDELVLSASGEVKRKDLYNNLPTYKQFMTIAKPLHTGEIFGLPSVILYFVISLIGCSLPITGFVIWWKRARKAW